MPPAATVTTDMLLKSPMTLRGSCRSALSGSKIEPEAPSTVPVVMVRHRRGGGA
jgi:hypothetical protein